MTIPRQNTVAAPAMMEGVGLHTGAAVRLRVFPAPVNHGVVFRRVDQPNGVPIPATVCSVTSTDRGTTLAKAGVEVHTVEHLLAAAAAQEIDNLLVEVDGPEVPICDGSALAFVELFRRTGWVAQDAPARVLAPRTPLVLEEGEASYVVTPAADYRISATIEWEHPLIRRQYASFRISPDSFAGELAAARTFCLASEVETLRGRGLARGGSPENAVVLTESGLWEEQALRFEDEFVRHKALDIAGDLALTGARLAAHVIAERPGHRGNVALAAHLLADERARSAGPGLDIQQILEFLPHRYPFLLVDRVLEYEAGKRIVGLKNVTINEPFFVGHFPGRPVMPGVLIIEAMAQVGGLLVMEQIEDRSNKIVYFMSLDKVKWRRPVTPGDQIRFEVEVLQIRGTTCRMRGLGIVDGRLVAEAEMMARVVDG
ncbi:MAG: bifunctional UDP-3-O-[3-hydroxymyristoyl] N-acetylglucosamine deacetylase/3-hydroxyacyl-ACP dehydratase [Gemmatimonadota bacterium]|jgi:UDP-3-O-[3-hydroxymyristoyl] N-acetylglucosamine deacetylase/3-hydroxyacyl-[acyl-carrier-protein] dehydratase|nr:bifunctional UDP-3-O-[3-hydroxymyristoyl] N-acetylglucosamine deacetylase/3-hydroxyacyl-ACP dehydratase [Gemmatimonadota bacterium]